MNWGTVIQLIITCGVEQGFRVWQIMQQHGEPDEEAWSKLKALSLKPYAEYIREAEDRARPPFSSSEVAASFPPDATKPDP